MMTPDVLVGSINRGEGERSVQAWKRQPVPGGFERRFGVDTKYLERLTPQSNSPEATVL